MNVPCMTLRDSAERPETIELGTNELLGTNLKLLHLLCLNFFQVSGKQGSIPHLWDGNTSNRIVQHLVRLETN